MSTPVWALLCVVFGNLVGDVMLCDYSVYSCNEYIPNDDPDIYDYTCNDFNIDSYYGGGYYSEPGYCNEYTHNDDIDYYPCDDYTDDGYYDDGCYGEPDDQDPGLCDDEECDDYCSY